MIYANNVIKKQGINIECNKQEIKMYKKYVRNWNNLVVNRLNLQQDYLWVRRIQKIMEVFVIINLLINIR